MEPVEKTSRTGSALLYLFGMLLALMLAVISLWADLEASLFSPVALIDNRLEGLRCPIIVTPNEAASIKATFANPTDQDMVFFARARVSQGTASLMRQMNEEVLVAARRAEEVEWVVRLEDAAFDRLILARVYVLRRYPLPARDQSCGMVVMNVPVLTGAQVVVLWLGLSLASLVGGALLWLRGARPLRDRRLALARAAAILTALILAALIFGMAGSWLVALLIVGAIILLAVGMAERFLLH
jgi:hypothetical protein